jgi:transcriptional regulator with XRE-family HTH domain
MIDLNPSHLSRVLRGADRSTPSLHLIGRIVEALGLPPGYFPELREAAVIEFLRADPKLRDRLYDQLTRKRRSRDRRHVDENHED